jgi:hypothetical protein
MKHTKKLVSVPEGEYQALLGLLTGGDPIKREKILNDQKISETFSQPNLSELVRGIRYQSLSRKRRMLNKKIEDKPIRVVLEQNVALPAPTSGIAPAVPPAQQIQEIQKQQREATPEEAEQDVLPPVPLQQELAGPNYNELIAKRFSDRLYSIVYVNREKLGIRDDGKIISNISRKWEAPPDDAGFANVLDYLVGKVEKLNNKKSGNILIKRLLKLNEFEDLIKKSQKQTGHGKRKRRYIVVERKVDKPIKSVKTRGLVRFKPLIWSKIPV